MNGKSTRSRVISGFFRRSAKEARERGGSGRTNVDVGLLPRELVPRAHVVLGDEHRMAAGEEHSSQNAQPIVRLVVENAVRRAAGRLLPGPHVIGAPLGRASQRVIDALRAERVPEPQGARFGVFERREAARALEIGHEPFIGADERVGAARLHGMEARHRFSNPERDGLLEPREEAARERAAADLHEEAIRRRFVGKYHFPGEALPALHRERLVRPLAGERDRARPHRAQKCEVRGVADGPRFAMTNLDGSAERGDLRDDGRLGVLGDEDAQRPLERGGEHGGREGGIAAARNDELGRGVWGRSSARPSVAPIVGQGVWGRSSARPSVAPIVGRGVWHEAELADDLEVDEDGEEVAPLVRARDVSRLVLHPNAARFARNPERIAERAAKEERGLAKTGPRDARHGRIGAADDRDVRLVGQTRLARGQVDVVEGAKTYEWVWIVHPKVQRRGAFEPSRKDVVFGGRFFAAGASEGQGRLVEPGHFDAAAGTNEPGAHQPPAATRALSSPMSSSQTEGSRSRPCQNAGSRRASKSASETPRCSTHVKYPRLKMRARSLC